MGTGRRTGGGSRRATGASAEPTEAWPTPLRQAGASGVPLGQGHGRQPPAANFRRPVVDLGHVGSGEAVLRAVRVQRDALAARELPPRDRVEEVRGGDEVVREDAPVKPGRLEVGDRGGGTWAAGG